MSDYIRYIRNKVGHDVIILNFAGACIANEKGELLFQKRSEDEALWGLPGGAVEIGESVEEAVIREVKEETGFDLRFFDANSMPELFVKQHKDMVIDFFENRVGVYK